MSSNRLLTMAFYLSVVSVGSVVSYLGLIQNRGRQPALLLEQGGQQVFDVNLLMAITDSFGLGRAERLLCFLSETVEIHLSPSHCGRRSGGAGERGSGGAGELPGSFSSPALPLSRSPALPLSLPPSL
jgi:hypothetical protein